MQSLSSWPGNGKIFKSRGYRNVRRYAGGMFDWEQAGFPVEGEMAKKLDQNAVGVA